MRASGGGDLCKPKDLRTRTFFRKKVKKTSRHFPPEGFVDGLHIQEQDACHPSHHFPCAHFCSRLRLKPFRSDFGGSGFPPKKVSQGVSYTRFRFRRVAWPEFSPLPRLGLGGRLMRFDGSPDRGQLHDQESASSLMSTKALSGAVGLQSLIQNI